MLQLALSAQLQQLVDTIETEPGLHPGRARQILQEAAVTLEDLRPWATFDHPVADSYGRKLIYDGGFFELMAMSWNDGDMSAIHDHGFTQWGAVKVFGPAEHAVFQLRDGKLTTARRGVCSPGEVLAVGHDLIHQMGNVGQASFLTLHLYGCYGRTGSITSAARLYDLDEGTIQFTSGGVFFDLLDGDINRREPGPQADFPTWLRHQVELLRRLLQKDGHPERVALKSPRAQRLVQELFAPTIWQRAAEEETAWAHGDRHQASRYQDILHQELFAAARLQADLLDCDFVNTRLRGADGPVSLPAHQTP